MSLKVVRFGAEWCSPCKTLKPVFEKVMATVEDVEFEEVDIDKDPDRASAANISSVPTIVFEKDGEVAERLIGLVAEDTIKSKIEKLKED